MSNVEGQRSKVEGQRSKVKMRKVCMSHFGPLTLGPQTLIKALNVNKPLNKIMKSLN